MIFDVLNWFLPVLFVSIGLFLSTQLFAKLVRYNPNIIGYPILTVDKIRIYNPLFYVLCWAKFMFNETITPLLSKTLPYALYGSLFALATIIAFSIIREILFNPNKLHGSARWGTEEDLKKNGMVLPYGVILGYFQNAKVKAKKTKETALQLTLKNPSTFVCHSGKANTLLLAPTGSGKGVGIVVPTCLSYPGSMVIFDPKGENYNLTAGHRSRFSHVIRFAPLSSDTICFNPLMAIRPGATAYRDANLIADILFAPSSAKASQNDTEVYFNNAAKDLVTTAILHIRFSDYEDKSFAGLLAYLTETDYKTLENSGAENEDLGKQQFLSMIECKHFYYDDKGNYHQYDEIHTIIAHGATRQLNRHPKERSSVFSTAFVKIQLFEDPLIANATRQSDFDLDDFVNAENPVSLYLTVPYSDIDRISPVFRLIITFILKKFSDGETQHGCIKLKNHLLFLLDEFPVLGCFPFLAQTMGVLRGYGINFLIVCQALSQIIDLYGQNHPFLDHCTVQCIFAPGKIEDAEKFSKSIGKESVVQTKLSRSGKRFDPSLGNLNFSDNDFARNLIDPEELMKLPGNEALILAHGMPPYIAKKVVFYHDYRFKDLVKIKPPTGIDELFAEVEDLPSNIQKRKMLRIGTLPPKEVLGNELEDQEILFEEVEIPENLEEGFKKVLESKYGGSDEIVDEANDYDKNF